MRQENRKGTRQSASLCFDDDFGRWSVAVCTLKTASHFPPVFHFGGDFFVPWSCPLPPLLDDEGLPCVGLLPLVMGIAPWKKPREPFANTTSAFGRANPGWTNPKWTIPSAA